MRRNKVLFGMILGIFLVTTLASAQTVQLMRGQVKRVGDFGVDTFTCGTANASTPDDCTLRYEYWSDVFSGEINRGNNVTGLPHYVLRGNPPGSRRGDYNAALANIGDFPVSGQSPMRNWYLSWFGELNGGTGDHIGYYATQSQIVDFGEFGNWNRFDCVGASPIACFTPVGPDPVGPGHSVIRADGTEELPLGGLSPIPIPRASLDPQNLLINVEWDAATGHTTTDGIASALVGYRVYTVVDTVGDQNVPAPLSTEYIELEDTVMPSLAVSIPANLAPTDEAVHFAVQLLYRSTANPVDAFERRSGFTLPNGERVEGLSANSNTILQGVIQFVTNFTAVTGTGNRSDLSWTVDPPVSFVDSFEVLIAKDAEAGATSNFGTGLLGPIPYDEAQTAYTAIDGDAGRSGSKVNIYRLKANFTDGTSLVSAPIVLFHKGKS